MKVSVVRVGELIEFIDSKEYESLFPKPVTPQRAVSQSKNPAAQPGDVALVYVADKGKLLAFAGLLSDELAEGSLRVFSNTGWWVHPELGRKYSLSVFLNALQACSRRMFLTDCTAKTREILERTGLFRFYAPVEGERFILRPYSADYIKRKGKYSKLSGLFVAGDAAVNLIISFRIRRWLKRNLQKGYSMKITDRIDAEANEFIRQHSEQYHLRQDAAKLNWIAGYKWLSTDKQHKKFPYPFSYHAESFRQEIMVMRDNHKIVGLVMLSWRDNHVSIPFVYYEGNRLQEVVKLTIGYLLKQKAYSVIVYRPDILKVFRKVVIPYILKLKVIRHYGFATELQEEFADKKLFQDGDGDVAFT